MAAAVAAAEAAEVADEVAAVLAEAEADLVAVLAEAECRALRHPWDARHRLAEERGRAAAEFRAPQVASVVQAALVRAELAARDQSRGRRQD